MTIGIVGLGLIGGSIGLALREPGRTILGCDANPASEKMAHDRFCVDRLAPFSEVVSADVVFVAVPPQAVVETLVRVMAEKSPDTLVTDCTSSKGDVTAWASNTQHPQFIISHPMAGHEKSGAAYASAWMFRGAKWIVSPQPWTDKKALKALEKVIADMGAVPVRMRPEDHDREIARVSHLPHALAGVLIMLKSQNSDVDVSGGSWKDVTRVSGVDPELWTQIFMANRTEIAKAIEETEQRLKALRVELESGNTTGVKKFFEAAKEAKEHIK